MRLNTKNDRILLDARERKTLEQAVEVLETINRISRGDSLGTPAEEAALDIRKVLSILHDDQKVAA